MKKTLNVRQYSIWDAFVLSFFSKDLYREVVAKWEGTGFAYLFLIVVLLFVPRAAWWQWKACEVVPGLFEKIPEFKIDQRVFSSPVQQPYVAMYEKNGYAIDTTGKINSVNQVPGIEKMENFVLVNKDTYTIHRHRLGKDADKTKPMFNLKAFVVDRERLNGWAKIVTDLFGVGIYLFMVSVWYPAQIVILLVYALLGILIAEMRNKDLDYIVALRLSVISHIPGLMLTTIIVSFGIQLPWPVLWSFLISISYLYFAINSQEQTETAETK